MKKLFQTLFLIFVLSGNLFAAVSEEDKEKAKEFIQGIADEAIKNVATEKNKDKRRENFKKIFVDNIYMDVVAPQVLNRYWKDLEEAEKKEFKETFEKYNVYVWVNRFSKYNGQKVLVKDVEESSGGKSFYVVTHIVDQNSSDEKVVVKWRVVKIKNRFWIVDIIIEGVSMTMSNMKEFSSVYKTGKAKEGISGIKYLIDELSKKTKELKNK